MWLHYLKTAWRNLVRNRIFSVINIFGLSIGLCCAMLILLYVKDETSFDKFHKNGKNIYQVVTEFKIKGEDNKTSVTGILPGPRFTQNVPGIKAFVRFQQAGENTKIGADIQFQRLFRVDSNFFSVFTFPLVSGNPATCLKEPYSIVLSEDAAKKHFGTTNAIGKVVMLKDDSAFVPYKVTAVAKNCPQNSSIRFEALAPLKISDADAKDDHQWFSDYLNTFVVLDNKANPKTVEKQMQNFYKQDVKQAFADMKKQFGDMLTDAGSYYLQPYTDMHFSKDYGPTNGMTGAGNPIYSYILSGIALFVLLIGCINFVNLTVARSVKRAKEIGIRKVVGGDRKQLIKQFLGESFLLCFIAFALALLLTKLVLPFFNTLANKQLAFSYLFDAKLIAAYVLLFVFTGLLAGFYPALVLSGFDPVKILYNKFSLSGKNYLQKTLVVVQFVLAAFLITITFVMYMQFNHLTHAKLGYDDSNLVLVNQDASHSKASVLKTMLLKNPNIENVAAKNGGMYNTLGTLSNDSTIQFRGETVNESFLPTLKIPIIQGRNFSTQFPSDSNNSILVNEAFAKQAGWANPIGQTVKFLDNKKTYQVVGLVKDYHYASMNEKIGPQLFTMRNNFSYGTFYIKIKPGTESESLKFIQKTFRQMFPLSPYSYAFKNDENKQQYSDIAKWKQIVLFGAILTIFISCIGLFGLSILSAEKRTKEIGIRKVYGASVSSIIKLLSKDFLKLVLLALIISTPFAWIAAYKFLQSMTYRISLSWWIFFIPDLLVVLIAFATIYFQTNRTAKANPVKSLKTE
ncbi:antibiotic ABC transporter permease [Arachidicoccus ginsenosidimutans]|uniref:ABC transporter permease n=1 Tax=Arachidicoccus sp. BS20 TaxID=1850526 RepID=UPI0007F13284|nr:ABC transporter permease [Arachidicoccus sp. BS20]ANI89886.1 antibiotic ABC transporter permease [Arachidicoccus sp. BS20]